MMIEPSYPLYGEDIETIDHLFWHCSITKRVWRLAFQHQWVPRQQLQGQHYFSQLLTQFRLNLNPKALRRATFLLRSIWKGQNELVFQNRQFDPIRILICGKKAFTKWEIRTCMSEGSSAWGADRQRSTSNFIMGWNAPLGDSSNLILTYLFSTILRQVGSSSVTGQANLLR